MWDTAGQERYRQIARMYYNDVCGAFVCFDLTEEDSFNAVNFWLQDLNANAPKNIVRILIGLKLDLVQPMTGYNDQRSESDVIVPRGISSEEAQMFAQRNKMFYMEVSAKTGHNVEQAFYKMAYEVHSTTMRQSQDSSSHKQGGKGQAASTDSEGGQGVMADRVKLTRPSNGNNQYAAANEVPTGLHEKQKKKCC